MSSPFAKALVPAVLGLVGVGLQWVTDGVLNEEELTTAVAALVTAILVYVVPNRPYPEPQESRTGGRGN